MLDTKESLVSNAAKIKGRADLRALIIATLVAVIAGCAIIKEVQLVNWTGEQRPCTFKFNGGFALNPIDYYFANRNLKIACVEGNRSKGWVPIETAGTVPIEIKDSDNAVIVTKVGEITPNLAANDLLLAVNGSAISSAEQAKQLLFGEKGSNVVLSVARAGKKLEVEVARQ